MIDLQMIYIMNLECWKNWAQARNISLDTVQSNSDLRMHY
jgi:hypothetical protein